MSVGEELPNPAQTWTPLTNAFHRLEFKFLNNVDSRFACELRTDGRLESFRAYLRRLWKTIGGVPDANKIDGLARDFKDELTDEYGKAEAEWNRIDRDLIQWAGVGVLAATGASMAGAIATGGFNLTLPALGLSAAGVLRILASQRERKEFRQKIPMSVFVDLSRKPAS